MALVKLLNRITAVMYNTNCQPVPTFQTVQYSKFDMNSSEILTKCVVNEVFNSSQCIAQSARQFCTDWSYCLSKPAEEESEA